MMRRIVSRTAACLCGAAVIVALATMTAAMRPDADDAREESTEVRYARASLRLAKIDLEQLLEEDQRVVGVVPETTLARARMGVKVAKARLEQALSRPGEDARQIQLRYSEERANLAELDVRNAENARMQRPDAISELQMERLQTAAEVARLRAALWREAGDLPSQLDRLQWQIDRLSDELIETNHRIR